MDAPNIGGPAAAMIVRLEIAPAADLGRMAASGRYARYARGKSRKRPIGRNSSPLRFKARPDFGFSAAERPFPPDPGDGLFPGRFARAKFSDPSESGQKISLTDSKGAAPIAHVFNNGCPAMAADPQSLERSSFCAFRLSPRKKRLLLAYAAANGSRFSTLIRQALDLWMESEAERFARIAAALPETDAPSAPDAPIASFPRAEAPDPGFCNEERGVGRT